MGVESFDEGWVIWTYSHIRDGRAQVLPKFWVIPTAWQLFHDRVSLVYDSVPAGHFSIFKEIVDLIVTLIRGGAPVGPSFIPDGSVGIQWGKHWLDGDLDRQFGTRIKYEHEYPPNFPQSASNPQPVWCYPDASLPEFRRWAREH
jgi:hypothetical protein